MPEDVTSTCNNKHYRNLSRLFGTTFIEKKIYKENFITAIMAEVFRVKHLRS